MSSLANAQHLRLVIGEYACTSNTQCDDDEYCDIDSHECKGKPICETCEVCETCAECETCPTPITCGDDEYNVNGVCVECISDDDCSEKCDTETNECKTCATIDSSKPYWNETTKSCESCPSETPKWDSRTKSCISCEALVPIWNGNACVTCASIDKTKPAYDSASKTCKTCYEVDLSKPMWNSATSICEACPDGQEWNITSNTCKGQWECRTNTDCADKGDNYYCYTLETWGCLGWGGEFCDDITSSYSSDYCKSLYSGVCRKTSDDIAISKTNTDYIVSNKNMSHASAKRFCQALGMYMMSSSDFNTTLDGEELLTKLYSLYGNKYVWIYDTADFTDNCSASYKSLSNGVVQTNNKAQEIIIANAICQKNTPTPDCAIGKFWNGTECVCPADKPYFVGGLFGCQACDEIFYPPVYDEKTKSCTTCYELDITKPYWNSKTKQCEICPDKTPVWYQDQKVCKTCESINATKPLFNIDTQTCEACPDETPIYDNISATCKTSCYEINVDKPVWNEETRLCEACPNKQTWDIETNACKTVCTNNSDCTETNTYCSREKFILMLDCTSEPDNFIYKSGICTEIGSSESTSVTGIGRVYKSSSKMGWRSAQNWCAAQGKSMLDANNLGCYYSGTTTAITPSEGITYCCASGQHCDKNIDNQSRSMQDLRVKWSETFWLVNQEPCLTYQLELKYGRINSSYKNGANLNYALCQ